MDDLRQRLDAFLAAHTTLALATVGPGGVPAAAAVFYGHDAALNLYFLSETTTEHGRNLLRDPRCAGAIQADGQAWRLIRGVQVRGRAEPVAAAGLPHAIAVYGKKFDFVGALLSGPSGGGTSEQASLREAVTLAGPLARARFWVLRPEWMRLIDNSASFGFKEEWTPGDADAA